jgi:hypothetical protein
MLLPLAYQKTGIAHIQWAATLTVALLIALIPINGAVECRLLARRGVTLRGWTDRVSDWLVAILAGILICATAGLIGIPVWWPQAADAPPAPGPTPLLSEWAMTVLACLLAMVFARSLFVFTYSRFRSPKLAIAVCVFIAWAAPLLFDLTVAEVRRDYPDPLSFTWLFGCSPAGTFLSVWTGIDAPVWPGLIPQALLALCATLAARRDSERLPSSDQP